MTTNQYALVSWCANDVLENAKSAEISVSRKEAEVLLRDQERYIADAMVSAGWEVIQQALSKKK